MQYAQMRHLTTNPIALEFIQEKRDKMYAYLCMKSLEYKQITHFPIEDKKAECVHTYYSYISVPQNHNENYEFTATRQL